MTGQPFDSNNAAVPSQVTTRTAATGGATTAITYQTTTHDSEETRHGWALGQYFNMLPEAPDIQNVTLNEGQGFAIKQVTNTTVGTWNVVVVVTLE